MSKKNNVDTKELLALLPKNIKNSKDLSKNTKMVIAQLIFMNGSEFVKDNGYFFATNDKLSSELGISKPTLNNIMRLLVDMNFITRTLGKQGVATRYTLNEETIKNFTGKIDDLTSKKDNLTSKVSTNLTSKINDENFTSDLTSKNKKDLTSKIDNMMLCINHLIQLNKELNNKVNTLETLLVKLYNNFTLDIDIEKERELNKESDIINNTSNIVNGNKVNSNIYKIKKYKLIKLYNILNKIKEKRKESNFEINLKSKTNNSKFEIKEVNHVGNEKKDMLLQSILNFKSSLENYKDNKPLAISIANGFYDKNKTSIEECNLNSVWDDVMNLINNIPTVEQNIPTLDDDEEDETYHYQDERSEFDKKLDAYARQVATGKLNFSTIM